MGSKKQKNRPDMDQSKGSGPKEAIPFLNKSAFITIALVLFVAGALVWYLKNESGSGGSNGPVNPESLPGIQTNESPWAPELEHLRERLKLIGLPALREEGSALHSHQHLDIFIHGKAIPVPQAIGFSSIERFISPIHTHNANGVIHIESPTVQKFTLGQFLDVWGVRFTSKCIGSYCEDHQNFLKVFINGELKEGDPRSLELADHQEIVIIYGTAGEIPKPVPAKFEFPAGS